MTHWYSAAGHPLGAMVEVKRRSADDVTPAQEAYLAVFAEALRGGLLFARGRARAEVPLAGLLRTCFNAMVIEAGAPHLVKPCD